MYGMIMILASGPSGLLYGQSLTTAALVVTTGLLIWFTRMAIKLRDQLVNSMSEIANGVVDKFTTMGDTSSSSVESSSASEMIDGAVDSAKGVAVGIGMDGGDFGGDDDGGGGGMGGMFDGGENVHDLFNEYGGGVHARAEAAGSEISGAEEG